MSGEVRVEIISRYIRGFGYLYFIDFHEVDNTTTIVRKTFTGNGVNEYEVHPAKADIEYSNYLEINRMRILNLHTIELINISANMTIKYVDDTVYIIYDGNSSVIHTSTNIVSFAYLDMLRLYQFRNLKMTILTGPGNFYWNPYEMDNVVLYSINTSFNKNFAPYVTRYHNFSVVYTITPADTTPTTIAVTEETPFVPPDYFTKSVINLTVCVESRAKRVCNEIIALLLSLVICHI